MRKVEAILEATRSPYLAPFLTLAQAVDQGVALATDNVKYLAILEAPCIALSKTLPKVGVHPPPLPPPPSCSVRLCSCPQHSDSNSMNQGSLRQCTNAK